MDRRTCKILEDYMLDCMADSAHDKEHVYRVLYHGRRLPGRKRTRILTW